MCVPRALPWAIMREAVGLMGGGIGPMVEAGETLGRCAVAKILGSLGPRIRRPTASLIIAQGNALGYGGRTGRRLKACRILGVRWRAGR